MLLSLWGASFPMSGRGYSVSQTTSVCFQAEVCKKSSEATAATLDDVLPLECHPIPSARKIIFFGITFNLPNGTIVTIKKGSAKSVMHLMKLYEKEDLLCLD